MVKKYRVRVELYMAADHIEYVDVEANTERKAKIFAERKAHKIFKTRIVRVLDLIEIE